MQTTYDTTGWTQMEINLLQAVVVYMLYNANIEYTQISVIGGTVTSDVAIPFAADEVLKEIKKLDAEQEAQLQARIAAEDAFKSLTLQQVKDKIANATSIDQITELTSML